MEKIIKNRRLFLFISIALVVGLGVCIYSNSFQVPFQFDGRSYLEKREAIRSFPNINGLIREYGLQRIVGFLSFGLNYRLHGYDVFGYHVVNLAVHLINGLLVLWLVRLILLAPRITDVKLKNDASLISLAVALFFIAHPIQVQAVTYIYQRLASLATLFYLLCLCLYLAARVTPVALIKRIPLFILALFSALLGFFTKQITFTLPFTILFFELFLFPKKDIKKTIPFILAVLLLLLVIPAQYGFDVAHVLFYKRVPGVYISGELTPITYFLTQLSVLVKYLTLIVFPKGLTVDHYFELSSSILDLRVVT